jgi:hypothetical protein
MLLLEIKRLLQSPYTENNYSCDIYDVHEVTLNLLEEKIDLQIPYVNYCNYSRPLDMWNIRDLQTHLLRSLQGFLGIASCQRDK